MDNLGKEIKISFRKSDFLLPIREKVKKNNVLLPSIKDSVKTPNRNDPVKYGLKRLSGRVV